MQSGDVIRLGQLMQENHSLLQQLTALGMIAHRRMHGMNYYRLSSETARQSIEAAAGSMLKAALRN